MQRLEGATPDNLPSEDSQHTQKRASTTAAHMICIYKFYISARSLSFSKGKGSPNVTNQFIKPYSALSAISRCTLSRKDSLHMLARRFCISRKSGTGGGGWGHLQEAVHMVVLGLAVKGPSGGPPLTLTAWTGLENTTLVSFWQGRLLEI